MVPTEQHQKNMRQTGFKAGTYWLADGDAWLQLLLHLGVKTKGSV